MLGEGLYSLLASATAVTDLVGTPSTRSDNTTGIFPVLMPEASPLPAVVLGQITGNGNVTMDGASALRTARLQFDCYAKNHGDSKRLAGAVWALIDGFNGTLPDGTEVDVALVVLALDSFDEAPFIYHVTLDVEFWFREPI